MRDGAKLPRAKFACKSILSLSLWLLANFYNFELKTACGERSISHFSVKPFYGNQSISQQISKNSFLRRSRRRLYIRRFVCFLIAGFLPTCTIHVRFFLRSIWPSFEEARRKTRSLSDKPCAEKPGQENPNRTIKNRTHILKLRTIPLSAVKAKCGPQNSHFSFPPRPSKRFMTKFIKSQFFNKLFCAR